MPEPFTKQFLAGWGAMDINGHLANTAYLDLAADARMAFFEAHGFSPSEFRRIGVGPVMRKDEIEYFREVELHEVVTVTCAAAAMSADASRYIIENEIRRATGMLAAKVRSTGGWLDLRARQLVAPPEGLHAAFRQIPRTDGFVELTSILRDR